MVSFDVRQLENGLGVTPLLHSARCLYLTSVGTLFYQRGVTLLKAVKNLQDKIQANHIGLSGELRIAATPGYDTQVIIPALSAFAYRHPTLRVRHISFSHHVGLISG